MLKHLCASGRGNLVLPLFCLAAVIANQAIFRLGAMSPLWTVVLVLAIAALYWFAPEFDQPEAMHRVDLCV